MKLDIKERQILNELDKNTNIPFSSLSKKTGLSRQVVKYRINKLERQNTIYDFYTAIDATKLGYSYFRANIRLKNVTEENYKSFAKELFTKYPTFWVAFVSGTCDLVVGMFAKSSNEFDSTFSRIIKENKNIIRSYERSVLTEANLYTYKYFLKEKNYGKLTLFSDIKHYELDDVNKKILKEIKYNSRKPLQSISSKVKLSRNAIKSRIKKLEENKIISGYKTFVNFSHFGKQSFLIFIKYTNSKIDQQAELFNYLEAQEGVLAVVKLLGKWNLDIEIHKDNVRDLQSFMINLRSKFDIIDDYEILQVIDDYGIDFFPDRLINES